MYLEVNPYNPNRRTVKQIIECLEDGGIIIYPTDTVYGLGCDIFNQKAIERICRIKGINPKKANMSFICDDISDISKYVLPFDNQVFKLMKRTLPGPYTYILKGSSNVPKLFKTKKRTVGIRIPDNEIARTLVRELGRPILSTSLKNSDDDDFFEYLSDPYEIYEQYEKLVDMVIDGGTGNLSPSTVIDCTSNEPILVRQGAGEF